MNDYIIKTENLGFTYADGEGGDSHDIPALQDVSIDIERGSYVAILGHNGSGKSTLAKLLNMILAPTLGKIYIDGKDVTTEDFTEDDVFDIRRKIGMVFQNPDNQLVATVVEEDVAFGPENLGLPREEIRSRVDSSLALVGMSEYAHHAPHKLSGGQKQRVAIAGIIAYPIGMTIGGMIPGTGLLASLTAVTITKGAMQAPKVIKNIACKSASIFSL